MSRPGLDWSIALGALLSYWRRHPGQALTLILGLALATALWAGVQAINAEARASYARASDAVRQTTLPSLVPRTGRHLPLDSYVALRRAGWQVAPRLEAKIEIAGKSYHLVGIDPLTAPAGPGLRPSNRGDNSGGLDGLIAFLTPPGQLLAHPGTLESLGTHPGLPPARALPDLAPGLLLGDLSWVSAYLGRPEQLSQLTVLPGQARDDAALAKIAPELRWQPPREGNDLAGLTRSFHLNLTAFGLLAFAVGLFIAHGAVGLAFEQRRDLFRTLRALGVTAKGLSGLLAGEMALVALLAAGLGIAMGYGIAAALLPNVAASLGGLYGAEIAGSIALRPVWILSGLAMTLGGAALATGRYLWQLAHSTPRANSLPRAWMRGSDAALRRQGIAACALILAAPLIAMLGQGLVAGFAILAAFLLGAALALPPLLSWAMGWASAQARRPLAEWFWADCRLQLPGLSLALMALMLAVAANIGVSTMVGSFRSTFTGWLDQRLPAELYINAGDDALAERLAPILQDEAESVLMITSLPAQLAGRPGTLYGQADHPTFRDNWPLQAAQPGVWQALHQGQGVLINEQLAYGADLSPGDMLEIDGRSHHVLGIYSDYGNPKPQAIAGLAPFLAAYPEAPRHRFALRLPPKAVPGAIARLQAAGLRPDQLMDQAGLKATSKQVFERTFAVTAALNILTLAVAGLAILTSLLTLAAQRLPQIAPVWAMGLSRAELGRLELLRAGVLAALTVGLALPVGLVLAWLLLAVINVEAFGWRLPMHLFPGDWARIGALAIAAALLAAAWPAWHLATRPPGDLLRRFANER